MHGTKSIQRALLRATLLVSLLLGTLTSSLAQEKVRPEVGKPLQAAQDMMKANKFKEALAKVREADAVSGKTPFGQRFREFVRLQHVLRRLQWLAHFRTDFFLRKRTGQRAQEQADVECGA